MTIKQSKDGYRILRNCDYRISLEHTAKADLIIADPPYNLDLDYWDKDFDYKELLNVITEKLNTGGSALIFNVLPNVLEMNQIAQEQGLYVQDLMLWVKPNFPTRYLRKRGYINKNREYILWVSQSRTPVFQLKPDETYHKGVFDYPSPAFSNGIFPFQKPKSLIDDLILRHSEPYALIMDLFAGSGIVAKSCKQWKRRYLGFEIDQSNFGNINLD